MEQTQTQSTQNPFNPTMPWQEAYNMYMDTFEGQMHMYIRGLHLLSQGVNFTATFKNKVIQDLLSIIHTLDNEEQK